jgi:hypothetical protein
MACPEGPEAELGAGSNVVVGAGTGGGGGDGVTAVGIGGLVALVVVVEVAGGVTAAFVGTDPYGPP